VLQRSNAEYAWKEVNDPFLCMAYVGFMTLAMDEFGTPFGRKEGTA
jgi:hypothetical protein